MFKHQLSSVAECCYMAMTSGIPIIYIETEDVELLDRLFRSERLARFWSYDCDKGWHVLTDEERQEHVRPQNISILNSHLDKYFDNYNKGIDFHRADNSEHYSRESFIAEHSTIRYYSPSEVFPRIIACRNFSLTEGAVANMQRLVAEHISSLEGDGIRQCFYILQSGSIQIPQGIEDYVEVISVPSLCDEEIVEIISDFVRDSHDSSCPSSDLMDIYTQMFRGFSRPKLLECLRKIQACCGSVGKSLYPKVDVSEVARKLINEAKKQMLHKVGTLRVKELGEKEAAGLEKIKEWIRIRKPLFDNAIEAHNRWAIESPKGLLVYGIPGTGKSLLAQEVARILKCPLIQMDMGALQSSLHGESERNMRQMIRMAESLAPCVLWIDEIEKAFSGVKGNGESDGGVSRRLFATFLTWMQEKTAACFIFATANDISSLPTEFLRRGRFDQKFFSFMPTKKECITIFRSIICGKNNVHLGLFDPVVVSDRYLDDVVRYCGSLKKFITGADIQGIVDDAKAFAYTNREKDHTFNTRVKYTAEQFKDYLQRAIRESHPYGETNIDDVALSLLDMARNQFAPSGEDSIVNILQVNVKTHNVGDFQGQYNGYDELLYNAIVNVLDNKFNQDKRL